MIYEDKPVIFLKFLFLGTFFSFVQRRFVKGFFKQITKYIKLDVQAQF